MYSLLSGSIVKAPSHLDVVKEPIEAVPTPKDDNADLASIIPGLTTSPLEPHAHYSAEELSMAVATSCVCALVLGFISGFLLARRCSCSSRDDDNPYHVPYLNQLVFLWRHTRHWQCCQLWRCFLKIFLINCKHFLKFRPSKLVTLDIIKVESPRN